MAAAEGLPAVNAEFIGTKFVGNGALNFMVGSIWGSAIAISQSIGSSFHAESQAAKAAGRAVNFEVIKAGFSSNLKTFLPVIVGHNVVFTMVRGNDQSSSGLVGLVKPLAITALPTAAFVAMKRTAPPAVLTVSLTSCVLQHLYDRCLKPTYVTVGVRPHAHSTRSVF